MELHCSSENETALQKTLNYIKNILFPKFSLFIQPKRNSRSHQFLLQCYGRTSCSSSFIPPYISPHQEKKLFEVSSFQNPRTSGKKGCRCISPFVAERILYAYKSRAMLVGVLKASLHLQYKKSKQKYRQVSKKNGDFATRKNTPNAQPVYQNSLATSNKKESENGNIHVSERATKNLAC